MEFIKGFRPLIGYDPLTGQPQIQINYQSAQEKEYTLQGLFNFLESQNELIVIAIDEFQQIADYPEKNIWLTGMPRYDLLEDHQEKIVYIVPTWRRYLMDSFDEARGVWRLGGHFQ